VTPEDFKFFRVEVSDHAGTIVSIESGMLNGREIGPSEEAKIREAIEHLQGFVGSGVDQPCWGCGTDNELHRAGCPMMAEQTTAVETTTAPTETTACRCPSDFCYVKGLTREQCPPLGENEFCAEQE
jgi:hypothetical protein